MKKILIFDPEIAKNYLLIKKITEIGKKVKIIKEVSAFENTINILDGKGGLEYFDLIIIEMYFNPYPLYGYEETKGGVHSGWFLYKQFMSEIKTKILIRSDCVYNYKYPTTDYPERKWNQNIVEIAEKGLEENELIDLIEKHLK